MSLSAREAKFLLWTQTCPLPLNFRTRPSPPAIREPIPPDFAYGVFHVVGKGHHVTGVHHQLMSCLDGDLLNGAVGVEEDGFPGPVRVCPDEEGAFSAEKSLHPLELHISLHVLSARQEGDDWMNRFLPG